MKNLVLKIVSVALVLLVLVCSVSFLAKSSEQMKNDATLNETDISLAMQTSIPRMLWTMENHPDYLGFEEPEGITLGQKFCVARIKNGALVCDDSVAHYPVCSNGNIIAVITLIKYQGEVITSIGTEFAPQLTSALDRMQNVVLLSTDGGIVAVGSNGELEILSSLHTMTDTELLGSVSESIGTAFSRSEGCSLSKTELYEKTVPAEEILKLYSSDIEKIRKNYYTTNASVPYDVLERGIRILYRHK